MTVPSPRVVRPAEFAGVEPRVRAIEDRVEQADGGPALNDAVWRDLEHPNAASAGFLLDDEGYAHVAPGDNTAPHWSLGITVAPDARTTGARVALIGAALAHVRSHGGGLVALWVLGATEADDAELARVGLQPARDLYEMRVALPIAEVPKLAAGFTVRDFEPGRDDADWVALNNLAFAGHAEQGSWTAETFARRAAESWFDPHLFLLAFDGGGLAAFNWLKMHAAHAADPVMGEIYVIGVAPRTQGTGVGRALALLGLQRVHERGASTGQLFCAADNAPALKLYRSLGFEVHRVDRAYETVIEAS